VATGKGGVEVHEVSGSMKIPEKGPNVSANFSINI